jgi:hypothetical protein
MSESRRGLPPEQAIAEFVRPTGSNAQIVITVEARRVGVHMRSLCRGRFDSSYAELPPGRIGAEVEKLVAELQAQLAEGS